MESCELVPSDGEEQKDLMASVVHHVFDTRDVGVHVRFAPVFAIPQPGHTFARRWVEREKKQPARERHHSPSPPYQPG